MSWIPSKGPLDRTVMSHARKAGALSMHAEFLKETRFD